MYTILHFSIFVLCGFYLCVKGEIGISNENTIETKAHPGRKVVCYFGSWSVYRPGSGKFDIESIDPRICTHYIFGFTGLRNGVVVTLDAFNEVCENWGKGALKRFALLKEQNPRLKTLVAIGGWNEGSKKYSDMARTAENRTIFIESVVKFLQRFDFDGFDLDWEYPAHRGGEHIDKENFALLVKEMREEFDVHGYILSAAVSAGEPTIRDAYDVKIVSRYLDFINVMSYDFRGAWDMKTGHHSGMYKSPLDTGRFETFNVNHSIHFWISQGAPREKLILGMGTYGRGVLLDKESDNGINAPGGQPLPPGPYTREAGYWGYNEICERLRTEEWTVVRDSKYIVAPYAYKGRMWVGYDDIESIKYKSQYILNNGLGGGMFWSLETDDFQGTCHGERFPLIKTAYRTIIGKIPENKWEPKPSRSTSNAVCRAPTTTISPSNSGVDVVTDPPPHHEFCKVPGHYYPDPDGNCQKFVQCALHDGMTWTVYHFSCGPGTVYDEDVQTCVLPNNKKCKVSFVSYNRQGSL